MAKDSTRETPRPFDVTTVEYLIGLMARHELTEIALQEGEHKIRLRKGGPPAMMAAPPPMMYPAGAPAAPAAHANAAAPAAAPPAAPAKALVEIKSEMVGTFYARPKPDKPDFVSVGTKIKPDTVVCIVEAMKIFNEVTAGVSGTIAEVCVKNGDFVEFGTVLYRVDAG